MTTSPAARSRSWTRSDAVLAFALLVMANLGIVHRQQETALATAAVVSGALAVVLVVWWLTMSDAGLRIPVAWSLGLLIAFWAGLVVVNVMIPDAVDVRADRDDALDLASMELVAGRDPWAVSTQIHETHHPSPALGGILLAAPFRLILGDSSWQNVAWLGIGLFLLVRCVAPAAGIGAVLLLAASPTFWSEWVYQSDLLTLGVKFAIAMLWGLHAMRAGGWVPFVLSALLFALVLADRFIFLAFALLMAMVALRWVPRQRAVPWLALSGLATGMLLVVPWVLAPGYREQMILNVAKGSEAGDVVPNAGVVLGIAMLVIAGVAGLLARDDAALLGSAALVTALVVAWQILLYSLTAGALQTGGSLAVAYTGIMLVLGIGYLVLPRTSAVTGLAYGAREGRWV